MTSLLSQWTTSYFLAKAGVQRTNGVEDGTKVGKYMHSANYKYTVGRERAQERGEKYAYCRTYTLQV